MRMRILASLAALWALSYPARAGESPDQVKQKLKDLDLVGDWVYDDLNAALAKAKEAGKPVFLVFR